MEGLKQEAITFSYRLEATLGVQTNPTIKAGKNDCGEIAIFQYRLLKWAHQFEHADASSSPFELSGE